MALLDGGLLNPVPIAPTFKDMTDLTIAVNLNAVHAPVAVPDKTRENREPSSVKLSSRHATVQRFLDSIQNGIQNTIERNFESRRDADLGMFDLMNSAFETMQNAISSMKLATYAPDVHIDIPRTACKAYEFDRAAELIELGYETAGKVMAARSASGRKDKISADT
jgi:NTE family protein